MKYYSDIQIFRYPTYPSITFFISADDTDNDILPLFIWILSYNLDITYFDINK